MRYILGAGLVVVLLLTTAALASAQTDRGQQVFAAQKCSICHSIAGQGNKKGPLDGVGAKLTADEIHQWLVNAPEMAAKTKAERKPAMKAYPNLPKDELDALLGYLLTLKK